MADEADISLPSQFLSDYDVFMDKDNFNNKNAFKLATPFTVFPTEFPYEFDSFYSNSDPTSPLESVTSSVETQTSEEEDDFSAGLTQRLAAHFSLLETRSSLFQLQNWIPASSPQSCLTGIGSPNGPIQTPSPSQTPFSAANDKNWDLINAAAREVARLKLIAEAAKYNRSYTPPLVAPPRFATNPEPFIVCDQISALNSSLYRPQLVRWDQTINQQCSSGWGRIGKVGSPVHQQQIQNWGKNSTRLLPQSLCPPKPQHHNSAAVGAVFHVRSGPRRECSGTGVFLPRTYTTHTEPRTKSGFPNVTLPAKANTYLVGRQRWPETAIRHDVGLPQEWTY